MHHPDGSSRYKSYHYYLRLGHAYTHTHFIQVRPSCSNLVFNITDFLLPSMFTSSQAELLRQLGPSYQKAIQQKQVEDFFQQAYRIWFDNFPEPRLDRDADDYEWVLRVRKKVCKLALPLFCTDNDMLVCPAWTAVGCLEMGSYRMNLVLVHSFNGHDLRFTYKHKNASHPARRALKS
jgi:hypothetical protein